METKIEKKQNVRFMFKAPSKFDVVMHNDDVTTMDFVVMVLETIFNKSNEEAEKVMMDIHTEGSAVVGTYFYDIALTKAERTMSLAKQNGFPLKVSLNEL